MDGADVGQEPGPVVEGLVAVHALLAGRAGVVHADVAVQRSLVNERRPALLKNKVQKLRLLKWSTMFKSRRS